MSEGFSVNFAPSLMRWWQPAELGREIELGMAKTSLPSSLAHFAVINDPDLMAASTTSVPKDNAAINLFLWGKKNGFVVVPGGYSEISRPI